MWHILLRSFFKDFSKNIVFRSVALVTKIHGDGVKNESAKTKTKTTGGAKRPSPQPV